MSLKLNPHSPIPWLQRVTTLKDELPAIDNKDNRRFLQKTLQQIEQDFNTQKTLPPTSPIDLEKFSYETKDKLINKIQTLIAKLEQHLMNSPASGSDSNSNSRKRLSSTSSTSSL